MDMILARFRFMNLDTLILAQLSDHLSDILFDLSVYDLSPVFRCEYDMLVSIPPKYSVSQIMGYLKGKSSLMIYEKYANLKYKYGNRHFWCRGYYVSTVGRNRRAIGEYIKNQLQEDYTDDQLSIKEFVDPFTGEPVRGGK